MLRLMQEVTLSKENNFLKIVLFSFQNITFISVLTGQSGPQSDLVQWRSSCQLMFDQCWLHNGCLHFLLALVAIKMLEGFEISGNYALMQGEELATEDVTTSEYCTRSGSAARSPTSSGSIWSNADNQESPTLSDGYRRESKGGTSILQLAQYFYFPINEAAKRLDICPTVLKKICRKHGLRRWPHRKLQSIERSLQKLRGILASSSRDSNAQQLKHLRSKIKDLEDEKEALCFNHDLNFI